MEKQFDVVVIGTGSAASIVASRCRAAGRTVAIIDARPFGGTCALRGCHPKKMLVSAGEALDAVQRMTGKGIRAAEVLAAPRFPEIAGQLVRLLRDRILVGHNIGFDFRFLEAEFRRMDVALPLARDEALCTMHLAGDFLPGAGRSLADCCAAFDIEGEPLGATGFVFDDAGNNRCGCPGADRSCVAVSAGLEPPASPTATE